MSPPGRILAQCALVLLLIPSLPHSLPSLPPIPRGGKMTLCAPAGIEPPSPPPPEMTTRKTEISIPPPPRSLSLATKLLVLSLSLSFSLSSSPF